jgi:hypothetical protein
LSKGKLNCRFLLKDGRGGAASLLPSTSLSPTASITGNPRHHRQHQHHHQQQPLSIMQKKSLGIKFATVQEEQDMMENFIRQVVDRMIATLNDATTTATTTSSSNNNNNNNSYRIPNNNNKI